MGMNELIDAELAALDDARNRLGELFTDFDLVESGDQVRIAREFEHFRNRLCTLDSLMLAGFDRAGTPNTVCAGSLKQLLTSTLSISPGDAARRVQLYEQLGPRQSMLGEHLGPKRPVLAAAVAEGAVSGEKAQIISAGLQHVDRVGFDPADIDNGEKTLTGYARTFGPPDIRRLTQQFLDAVDPDGSLPKEKLQEGRRFFEIRSTKDGGFEGKFRLTATCGTKLTTLLRPLSRVRVDESGQVDERPFVQRQHDSLEELCDRLLRDGLVSDGGNPSVTVIVTVDADDLQAKTGHATTTDGNLISTSSLLDMASEADIIPTVLNASGAVLDLGRTKRCASRTQTLALIARDLGCSFPGVRREALVDRVEVRDLHRGPVAAGLS